MTDGRVAAPLLPPHAHHHHYLQIVGVLCVALVLSAVVPIALIAEVPNVGRSGGWILTLGILVWSGIRLSIIIADGKPLLFDFFFWVFCYVFMGLAPTVQIRGGDIATTTPGMDPALDVPTATLVWAGIVAYEAGRLIAIARERRRRDRGGTDGAQPIDSDTGGHRPLPEVSGWRTAVVVAFGVAASAYFVVKVGVGSLFENRYAFEAVRAAVWPDSATNAVMRAVAVYPILVGVGALTMLRRQLAARGARGRARWLAAATLACALLLVVVANPISSARYAAGTVLFALAVYAGAVRTRHRARFTLVGTIVGLIFLFPLADIFRVAGVDPQRTGFFGEYAGNPDYDAFWQIANAHSYVVDGLVQFGQQALGSIFFWVPRRIWPDKPIDTGTLLAQYRGYSFGNLSAPLWAELLVNGGLGALVVGFVLLGVVLRRIDVRLLPAFPAAGYWAIAGAIFPVYMMILLRGSLLQATGSLLVAVCCVLAVRRKAGRRHVVDVSGGDAAERVLGTISPEAGP